MKIETESTYIEQISVGTHKNFAYLIGDLKTGESAVIDPAWEIEKIIDRAESSGFAKIRFVINTHAHYDHIEGNQKLVALTRAKILMHEASLAKKDQGVVDGEELMIGASTKLRFIHTPGHSPESMCIQVNNQALLTGDTLFIGECGRVDLPGGDANALFDSFEKIRTLNKDLIVLPGHDYGAKKSTSLADQLATNYTLVNRRREEFVEFMNSA